MPLRRAKKMFQTAAFQDGVISFLALIGLISIFLMVMKVIELRNKIVYRNAKLAELAAEDKRIAALPKLDTQYLMRMPDKMLDEYGRRSPCTFNVRYNRLIAFDESGQPWVGLVMEETLESLRDGEYVQDNYYVPFRGAGESTGGAPVFKEGVYIHLYPIWMSSNATDTPEWATWASFERAFREQFKDRNCQHVFNEIMPREALVRAKRKRFVHDELRSECAMLAETR
jgi:hypothetical protein